MKIEDKNEIWDPPAWPNLFSICFDVFSGCAFGCLTIFMFPKFVFDFVDVGVGI